ncbi:craniofacial development protein 2-like [Neoarius graeffei]|uniref:craniofacial development protein 2-like n=1 Tax=Neoarius graeffei TaxID=443677 RepID=UPI00298C8D57|nr:craniofacial development protein 2-like [Neoarius graeffei]
MADRSNTRVRVPNVAPTTDRDPIGSNDDLSPNPQGRNKPGRGTCMGRRLINCRNITTISTLNVRTIKEARYRKELATNLSLYGIDVLGIQEHRIVHEEVVRYEDINGGMLITTSATRNQAGAAVGGVGILLSSKASFQGNLATTITVTYCPTNTADEDIVKAHYDDLVRAIESIPSHNLLLVVGDFNARIGPEDAKFTFHKETNRNARQLLDLASEKDLVISSTYFRKKAGKLWTFISPGGIKYQLDYVLIHRKWCNSMLNVEAYNSFASVGSDHRIISARVRLSLQKKKAESRKRQDNWNLFKSRRDIQELYTIEVHNRFQPLQELDESATDRYRRFIKATEEAAEKVVPIRNRGRKTRHSEDSRVTHARDELNRVYE